MSENADLVISGWDNDFLRKYLDPLHLVKEEEKTKQDRKC